MLTLTLPNAQATHTLGIALGRSLPPGSNLLLVGDLGSGKTSLVQGIGEGLGITEPVSSPTFVLLNEYLEGRIPLYHLDLYRLEPTEVDELYLENYWEGIESPLGIVAIEWAERLGYLPSDYLKFQWIAAETGRVIQISTIGESQLSLEMIQELIKGDFREETV
jgi:tRNA threonylcarbamoyladenosine biosynthesis protein TsaE